MPKGGTTPPFLFFCIHSFFNKFCSFVNVQVKYNATSFALDYLTLGLVSSLNNPKNSEMKYCENMTLIC